MLHKKLYRHKNRLEGAAMLNALNHNTLETVHEQTKTKSRSDKVKQSRGHVAIVADLCKGCYLCIEACRPGVLKISKSLNIMGYHPVEYVGEGCTGCGVCFYICPEPGSVRVYKRGKAK